MDKMTYRAGTREVNLTRLDSIRDLHSLETVSYTHLTLPTNSLV